MNHNTQPLNNPQQQASQRKQELAKAKKFRIAHPARQVRLGTQFILLILLNFTVIGSLYVSPVLPILRFPKFWELPGLGEGVPLCTGGTLSRTLTTEWTIALMMLILGFLFLVGVLIGRALCGWACPIGFIQDLVIRGRKGLKIRSLEPSKKVHNKLKFIRFAILFLVITLAFSIGMAIFIDVPMGETFRGLCDPMAQTSPICLGCPTPILRYLFIDVGYNFDPNFDNPSNIFQLAIFLMFIIGIIAIPRFWCRYLCPVGALSSIFNKISLLHLHKDQSKCTRCNYCVDVCPTRVESVMEESEIDRIGDISCTYCMECVEACPEKALSLKFGSVTLYKGGKQWWEHEHKPGKRNN